LGDRGCRAGQRVSGADTGTKVNKVKTVPGTLNCVVPAGPLRDLLTSEYRAYQGAELGDLEYAPGALYVDFDGSLGVGEHKEYDNRAEHDVDGRKYVPLAWLFDNLEAPEPCYAYLIVDPTAPDSKVYLGEPSGEAELIAESVAAFVARLVPDPFWAADGESESADSDPPDLFDVLRDFAGGNMRPGAFESWLHENHEVLSLIDDNFALILLGVDYSSQTEIETLRETAAEWLAKDHKTPRR